MCNQGLVLTTCHLEDCLWMLSLKGVGPLVRSWGEFRNTLGSLRPLSSLCSLGKVPKFLFFLILGQLVTFFVNNFLTFFQTFFDFFLTFSKTFSTFPSPTFTCTYMFSCLFHGLRGLGPKGGALSQLATGCVTCHTSHGCVTHLRPIFGNLVEVTLVTSPFMYIVSHTKGTSFP